MPSSSVYDHQLNKNALFYVLLLCKEGSTRFEPVVKRAAHYEFRHFDEHPQLQTQYEKHLS